MPEYIEKEAIKAAVRKRLNNSLIIGWLIRIINEIPTADVAPVVHGRWGVEVGMNWFKERICPVCKKYIESNFWNYCPNCGARMDGE